MTRNLRSAEYTLGGSFDMTSTSVSARGTTSVNGRLTDAGKQLRFLTEFNGSFIDPSQLEIALDGALEIVVIDKNKVYLNLHALNIQPEVTMVTPSVLNAFIGKWWLVPAEGSDSASTMTDMTPEPALLRAQSEVVTVTADKGPEMLDGSPAYHYAVAVDPAKFVAYMAALAEENGTKFDPKVAQVELKGLAATGELWIDASTFHLKKAIWTLTDLPFDTLPGGKFNAIFTVTLRSQNAALEVSPPDDARLFDPAALLKSGLSPDEQNTLFPPGSAEDTSELPFYFEESL